MKNKLLAFFLVFILIFSLSACKGENGDNETTTAASVSTTEESISEPAEDKVTPLSLSVGEYSEWEWNDEYEIMQVQTTCSLVKLNDDSAKKYPSLAKSLDEGNEERKQRRQEIHNEMLEASQDMLDDMGSIYGSFEGNGSVAVRRADSVVTSLLHYYYRYDGGMHGYYSYWGDNFNSKTGEIIELSDVVTDMNALPALVIEQLDIYYEGIVYDEANVESLFAESEYVSWTLDYNGITFYFNPYDIAAYASGSQTVTLTFADNPNLVKEEYLKIPESYAVSLSTDLPFMYDLNNDGKLDEIIPSYSAYNDGEPLSYSIFVDGKDVGGETDGYGVDFTFIHTKNGDYIYAQFLYDNDFRSIKVYDVSGENIEEVGETEFSMPREYDYDEEINYRTVLTNPESFEMNTVSYMLGTAMVSAEFSVSENGMPKTADGLYTVDGDLEFTLLKDSEVEIIDAETGKTTGKAIVKTGEKVKYYRTDNESKADLLLADGRIGRVTVENNDWTWAIDGVDVEEIFDGLLFAG